jgi:hypothetical protein
MRSITAHSSGSIPQYHFLLLLTFHKRYALDLSARFAGQNFHSALIHKKND